MTYTLKGHNVTLNGIPMIALVRAQWGNDPDVPTEAALNALRAKIVPALNAADAALELARSILSACVRLNDAQAVANGDKETLAEELDDMQAQAAAFLSKAGVFKKPVAVTLCKPGMIRAEVLERFATIAQAESFLATSATVDPDDLEAGHYGIDAPEEMVNP